MISRSGSTSEAVEVAEKVRGAGHLTVAVTCRPNSPLATRAHRVLLSPAGDEQAIVMTRSFTSMLALLLRIVAGIAPDPSLADDLDQLPERWQEAVAAADVGHRLGSVDHERIVVLGGGPARGIASEWCLKLTETSQIPTERYEPLEFRHGPISVCEPGVLVVGLIGGPGASAEARVLREAGGHGAETWLIDARSTIAASPAGGRWSGATSTPGRGCRCSLYPGQALAFSQALLRGRDPDAPRHLGQVVILERG